jgi:hypothetical protein
MNRMYDKHVVKKEIDEASDGPAGWTGDNWWWCGCNNRYGDCSTITCTQHKDAPR